MHKLYQCDRYTSKPKNQYITVTSPNITHEKLTGAQVKHTSLVSCSTSPDISLSLSTHTQSAPRGVSNDQSKEGWAYIGQKL